MVKWLLIVLIFNLPESEGRNIVTKVYANEGECNAVSENVRSVFKNLPEDVKTVSVCIPESAYALDGWREW